MYLYGRQLKKTSIYDKLPGIFLLFSVGAHKLVKIMRKQAEIMNLSECLKTWDFHIKICRKNILFCIQEWPGAYIFNLKKSKGKSLSTVVKF